MSAFGFYDTRYDCPTNAGMLFFAKNLRRFIGGAYIQYVVDGFKGVWVDKKTFNRYYWGFIGLLEIAVCALSLLLYYWVKFGAPWNC